MVDYAIVGLAGALSYHRRSFIIDLGLYGDGMEVKKPRLQDQEC